MCDILRRLASPNLTKQQYLSSLNEFSRLCRAKRKEELFLVVGRSVKPHNEATDTTIITSSNEDINFKSTSKFQNASHDELNTTKEHSGPQKRCHANNIQNAESCSPIPALDISAAEAAQNPIFMLNRADEKDIFKMDDVFDWLVSETILIVAKASFVDHSLIPKNSPPIPSELVSRQLCFMMRPKSGRPLCVQSDTCLRIEYPSNHC